MQGDCLFIYRKLKFFNPLYSLLSLKYFLLINSYKVALLIFF